MKPESPQCLAGDMHREVTAPPTRSIRTAGQIHPDLIVSERHPVDATLTQSMAQGRLRRPVAGKVLVAHHDDPSRAHPLHEDMMPHRAIAHQSTCRLIGHPDTDSDCHETDAR